MKYKVSLNNKVYEVVVEKGQAIVMAEYAATAPSAAPVVAAAPVAAAPVAAAPAAAAPVAAGAGEPIPAPLPGTVVGIKCTVGQSVKKGDVLVLIEAMKMENEIVAPHDGVIGAIVASKGASV
ncbi:MAG: biotin/lipoyl-containing protein, partial [Eubacteriales bacterium]|nr:biotin/lipoyl-containing protein [Eubacteriales bacterium]